MVMTIERLVARQVPKSITGSELMFKKSANPMTGEEVLFLLGQVQHREPIGALVLDAIIAENKTARSRLVRAIQSAFSAAGKGDNLAYAIAEAAVHEVCDTCICKKCNGTGQVYSKKFNKINQCNKCEGLGRVTVAILTESALLKSINQHLPQPLAKDEWIHQHYDDFMSAVDTLNRHTSDAGHCARVLLDGMGE